MLKNVTLFSHEQHSNTENILILIVHYDCFTCLSNFYKLFTCLMQYNLTVLITACQTL